MAAVSEVHWSIVPDQTNSPYVKDVVAAIERGGVRVVRMSLRGLLRSRHRLVHIQWPEHVSRGPGRLRAALKAARAIAIVAACRWRGHQLVFTAHNLEPHLASNRVDDWFRRTVERRSVAAIVMAPGHIGELEASGVDDVRDRAVVIRHPMRAATNAVDAAPDGPILVLGLIASYHRPHEFVETLANAGLERRVVVIGAVGEASTLDALRQLEESHRWLDVRAGFMEEEALRREVDACSAVVALQRRPFNSGAPFFAVPHGRPVVLTESALTDDLAATIGPDWVHAIPSDLNRFDPAAFEQFLRKSRTAPSVGFHDADLIALDHIALYERLATER